jgi:D-alanine-D-alanine ligase
MRSGLMTSAAELCVQSEPPACSETGELEERIERLMSRLRLAVIFGGSKSIPGSVVYQCPNARAWKSYESVAQDIASSLGRIGFRHVQVLPDDMHLGERLHREGIHMAWLNSGGVQGYNSAAHAPAMLEMLGVPYVGHDSLAATTLDNKHAFKREAVCAGLPTAPFSVWNMARGPFRPEINSRFQRAFGRYSGPFVVKPVSGRASLHVHVASDLVTLPGIVAEVYQATENAVLIEKYLPGREFCVAVAGQITALGGRLVRRRDPFTFAILERVLTPGEKIFTSMDLKPISGERFRAVDAQRDAQHIEAMRRIGRDVFFEFNLRSLIRIDLRLDENGELNILEVNPKPDLKQPREGVTSLISAGLPEVGMDYDDLILSLLADRFDFLFTHRREAVRHILDLLDENSCTVSRDPKESRANVLVAAEQADGKRKPATASVDTRGAEIGAGGPQGAHTPAAIVPAVDALIARMNDVAADANVLGLTATLEAAGADGRGETRAETRLREDRNRKIRKSSG